MYESQWGPISRSFSQSVGTIGSYLQKRSVVSNRLDTQSIRPPKCSVGNVEHGDVENVLLVFEHAFCAHTWMYSVRELKICFVTTRALEKLCCPDSSMMSFPE